MNALLTARLAAWREVRARWPLFVIAPALLLLGLPRRPEVRDAVGMFVLVVILPPLTMYLAARPGARADAFWRGLGGPAWASLLGAVAVHAAVLGATALAAAPRLADGATLPIAVGAAVLAFLYVTTAAARAFSGGGTTIAGVLVGGSLLLLGSGLSLFVWKWPPVAVLGLRATLLIAIAAGLAVWGEVAFGAWGGAVRKQPWRVALCAAAAVLFIPLVPDAADVGDLWSEGLIYSTIAPDGRSAELATDRWGHWSLNPGRSARWSEAGGLVAGPPPWERVQEPPPRSGGLRTTTDRGREVILTGDKLAVDGVARPIPLPEALDRRLAYLRFRHAGDRLVLQLTRSKTRDGTYAPGWIAVVDGDALQVLAEGEVTAGVELPDAYCARVAQEWRCWTFDPDPQVTVRPAPPWSRPFAGGVMLHWADDRIHQTGTDRSWALPEPAFWSRSDRSYWQTALQWRTRPVDGGLRVFHDDRIEHHGADGEVTVLARWRH